MFSVYRQDEIDLYPDGSGMKTATMVLYMIRGKQTLTDFD